MTTGWEHHLKAIHDCATGLTAGSDFAPRLSALDAALAAVERSVAAARTSQRDIQRGFAWLSIMIAELPPASIDGLAPNAAADLKAYGEELRSRRRRAQELLKTLLRRPELAAIQPHIHLFDKLIDACNDRGRHQPFRVVQIAKVADLLYALALHLDPADARLPRALHKMKYLRFGTSGWRARWGVDFDEVTAKCVAQAICDYVLAKDLPANVVAAIPNATDRAGKTLVIGYDSRANAKRVAMFLADVARRNGIPVDFAERDTPTPALIYWGVEKHGEANVAGIINCTASHNPVEWQGIKFSPFNGVPAPSAVTDFLASRANAYKFRGLRFPPTPIRFALGDGITTFDALDDYTSWLLSPEREGIKIDPAAIKAFFKGKSVVLDEMHGTSRGYMRSLMRRLGVRYKVIHGEKSPTKLASLHYASPEWPHIKELTESVGEEKAFAGFGCDTDADRFGIVDENAGYAKPNEVLPVLLDHLLRQGYQGKVMRTVTGSRLTEKIVASHEVLERNKPSPSVLPPYVNHPFYEVRTGDKSRFQGLPVFLGPVGIKYVVEGMLYDRDYKISYKPGFRNTMLLGGEESSGLTTIGHIPDKDGIWGNLLVLQMLAVEKAGMHELWQRLQREYGDSWFERLDLDASDQAKEMLLTHFLTGDGLHEFAGCRVDFIGGVMFDVAEVQLTAPDGRVVYLELRASGTEPLNRIYVEAPDEALGRRIQRAVLDLLEGFSVQAVRDCTSEFELSEVLCVTPRLLLPDSDKTEKAVAAVFKNSRIDRAKTRALIVRRLPHLEHRNVEVAEDWRDVLA
jgi:phosphomannomutase